MGAERGRELLQRARHSVVLGDGPMGTMLYQRGMAFGTAFEHLNLKAPALVKAVHRQYLLAGAELLETNTFAANAWRLRAHGLESRVRELNEAGARLARSVAGARAVVAGSVGPLGLKPGEDLPPDADAIFREAIVALANGGVDLLLLETFTGLDEAEVALSVARAETDLPVVVQFAVTETRWTARGTEIGEACRRMVALGAEAVGTNCGKGPRAVIETVEHLVLRGAVSEDVVLGAYPNAGFPERRDGRYIYLSSPEYTASVARQLVDAGVSLLGGCCGMTPEDVAAMKVAVRGRPRVSIATARARLEARRLSSPTALAVPAMPAPPIEEPSAPAPARLDRLRTARPGAADPVIIVEIDPPKHLDPSSAVRACRRLAEAGAYAVTVGDNPLAVTRLGHLAFSHLVQREVGIPVIMHLSCRDRNLIGLRSALMGAHTLGVRAVLAVTGDPASIGSQPGAKSVYDTNSFGLCGLVGGLNRGEGLRPGQQTGFTLGVAFNPNGRRVDDQLRRLARKVELGAQFAQTQPCFQTERVREMYERAAPLGIPIFLGLLPLLSARAAEFVHNEIPGIDVPEAVRRRLRGKGKDEARAEGMRICEEQIRDTFDVAHGYYLIPPFSSARAALELCQLIRAEARRRGQDNAGAGPQAEEGVGCASRS